LVLIFVNIAFSQNSDEVTSVPGFTGTIPFKQYAGYLSANDGQKQLFYWFVQSQNNPATDPVVLWLNGGPGCSSFDGFVYEHGPFTFQPGGYGSKQNLTLNPYSWNKVANMIYLDSPCGVGLSYSNDPVNDYVTNDQITAKDSHNFLLNFFAKYSNFKNNKFFISGESYAGVYVPTLAKQVVEGNLNNPSTAINLRGILVGNGVTDEVIDGNAWVPFLRGHALIDHNLNQKLITSCQGNYWNASQGTSCYNYLNDAGVLTQYVNVYDIYLDCYGLGPNKRNMNDVHERMKLLKDIKMASENIGEDVPCINSKRATEWINQDSVRTAIHAVSVAKKRWSICTGQISYSSTVTSTIPYHKYLLQNGIRILIYSGDVDMCVPNTGSETWTRELGLPLVSDWRPWIVNYQVAGYVREYKGLTYCTVKGSGHMVPQFKPRQGYHMFVKTINAQQL